MAGGKHILGKPKSHRIFGTARVGERGQIVIPKEVREMFGLEPGDSLILLADKTRGIALQSSSFYEHMVRAVFDGKAGEVLPEQSEEEAQIFASNLKAELEGGDEP